jgi:hypothetical protein
MKHRRLLLLCCALTIGNLACAPKLIGPTSNSGYFFSILTTPMVLKGEPMPLVVQVQDARGNPVNGIPVEFEVEPAWRQEATVSASRVITSQGRAQTIFRAELVGIVRVTVRVDHTTAEIEFSASIRGGPSGGA